MSVERDPARSESDGRPQVALVDLLDRLLAGGVVVAGEVTLSIADIDLVQVSLRALVSSTETLLWPGEPRGEGT